MKPFCRNHVTPGEMCYGKRPTKNQRMEVDGLNLPLFNRTLSVMSPRKLCLVLLLVTIVCTPHLSFASATGTTWEPLPPSLEGFQAVVVGSVCNIRKGPSTDTGIIGTVNNGDKLSLLDFKDNWAKIKHGSGEGWIAGWLINVDLKAEGIRARIIRPVVNRREGPDLSYDVVDLTYEGDTFDALTKQGEWISVKGPSGSLLWVFEPLLVLERQKVPGQHHEAFRITGEVVNFRGGPGTDYPVIGTLYRGDALTFEDEEGGWTRAKSSSGQAGWVATYLTDRSAGDELTLVSAGLALAGKVIVVDPGHGGSDPGVISSTGVREKDVTLAVALKTRSYLESLGAKVIMTRTGDYTPGKGSSLGDLDSRVYLANSQKADIFVSIHVNSYPADNSISGVIGFYYAGSAKAQLLAGCVAKGVAKATGMVHRSDRAENFRVLRCTSMPATLLELGFMTNKGDLSLLTQDSFQKLAAKGIAQGILTYFGK